MNCRLEERIDCKDYDYLQPHTCCFLFGEEEKRRETNPLKCRPMEIHATIS